MSTAQEPKRSPIRHLFAVGRSTPPAPLRLFSAATPGAMAARLRGPYSRALARADGGDAEADEPIAFGLAWYTVHDRTGREIAATSERSRLPMLIAGLGADRVRALGPLSIKRRGHPKATLRPRRQRLGPRRAAA